MARLAFLGSPDAAVPSLRALVEGGHDVALVMSRADTRRGRGGAFSPSPVKRAALELGIPTTDRLDDVLDVGAELGVVVAYGRIVPARVLAALDMVNVHFSLLPRWRGAAPVERAVLAGDEVTGVCLMRLEEGLDTGPVLARREVAMGRAHAGELTDLLASVGAGLLVESLRGGVASLGPGVPQQGEATYAPKIDPAELRLDWAEPARHLERVVRLDRAWTTLRGKRLRVLDAAAVDDAAGGGPPGPPGPPGTVQGTVVATGQGGLALRLVQPEGKRPVPAEDWLRGVRLAPGERLGGDVAPR
ncbi:MAG: methionyl-tRNA formyltransferase [Acidimicrobiales bacterium]